MGSLQVCQEAIRIKTTFILPPSLIMFIEILFKETFRSEGTGLNKFLSRYNGTEASAATFSPIYGLRKTRLLYQ